VLCLSVITAVIVVLAISFSVLNVLHMLNIFGSNQIASAVRQRSSSRYLALSHHATDGYGRTLVYYRMTLPTRSRSRTS